MNDQCFCHAAPCSIHRVSSATWRGVSGSPADVPGGHVVAEVAALQLETCIDFRPRVGASLNITEDHLDRYGTMEVYASMRSPPIQSFALLHMLLG